MLLFVLDAMTGTGWDQESEAARHDKPAVACRHFNPQANHARSGGAGQQNRPYRPGTAQAWRNISKSRTRSGSVSRGAAKAVNEFGGVNER